MTANGTRHQVVMGGVGGRGILTIGKVLAQAGLENYNTVSYFANYGGLMRGGDSEVTVILSESAISSQAVLRPEAAIVMSPHFFTQLLPRVQPGGVLLADEDTMPKEWKKRDDISVYLFPVTVKSLELGNSQIANFILLGAYLKLTGVLTMEQIEESLDKRLMGTRREHLLVLNKKALAEGAKMMADVLGEENG